MNGLIRIGSRGSKLAILQTRIIGEKLRELYPDWNYRIIPIKTRGDLILPKKIGETEGKGIFVKEIEEALLRGDVDLAVHSLKDLPTESPPGAMIAAVLERDDPREAFLSRSGQTLAELPPGSRIGTSSLRRMIQLKEMHPDIEVMPLRGNVPTRIQKMNEGEVEALVVALAGLKRLSMENLAIECFSPEIFVPAAGQGALAVETRQDEWFKWVQPLNHTETEQEIIAERAFLKAIGGGCRMPVGAWGKVEGDTLTLWGLVGLDNRICRGTIRGKKWEGEDLGEKLARRLIHDAG